MRTVLVAEGPVEPVAAIEAYLAEHPPTSADPVHLLFGTRRSVPPMTLAAVPHLTVGSFLPGRGLREVPDLVYHRRSYSQICASLRDGSLRLDVLLTCASSSDGDGVFSLGGVNGYLDLAVAQAGAVVVEEVPWLPRVPGATLLSRPAQVLPSRARADGAQPSLSAAFDETDLAIAGHVASLLPDEPVLALGIGRVSDALADVLAGRRDLTLVTGVVTEGLRALAESGALRPGPIQAMAIVGSPAFLRWCARPGAVQLLPSTLIHDPTWLAGHDRFVAVLGALEVDLAGNVNSELVGTRLVSGRGGAPDFAAGAHRSRGGATVVALRSTDRAGRSRLVDALTDPSIAGGDVDAIATDRGAVWLRGLDAEARRSALQSVFFSGQGPHVPLLQAS